MSVYSAATRRMYATLWEAIDAECLPFTPTTDDMTIIQWIERTSSLGQLKYAKGRLFALATEFNSKAPKPLNKCLDVINKRVAKIERSVELTAVVDPSMQVDSDCAPLVVLSNQVSQAQLAAAEAAEKARFRSEIEAERDLVCAGREALKKQRKEHADHIAAESARFNAEVIRYNSELSAKHDLHEENVAKAELEFNAIKAALAADRAQLTADMDSFKSTLVAETARLEGLFLAHETNVRKWEETRDAAGVSMDTGMVGEPHKRRRSPSPALAPQKKAPIQAQTLKKSGRKMPPVIVKIAKSPRLFIASMKPFLANEAAVTLRNDGYHITSKDKDSFLALKEHLKSAETEFFTFPLAEDRSFNVFIRGLHADFSAEEVKEDLEGLGFSPLKVLQLKKSKAQIRQPFYIACFRTAEEGSKALSIRTLLQHRVRIDKCRKRQGVVQCFNCQQFNHTAHSCYRKTVCVICGGEHRAKDCSNKKETGVPAHCHNCKGSHPSSFRECPAFPAMPEKVLKKPGGKTRQPSRPPQRQAAEAGTRSWARVVAEGPSELQAMQQAIAALTTLVKGMLPSTAAVVIT